MSFVMSLPQFSLDLLLVAWLGICVVFDLRFRQLPAYLTIPPLILAVFWRLLNGGWQISLLTIALILISDLPQAKLRIGLSIWAGLVAMVLAGSEDLTWAILTIVGIWFMWEINATGGADAKIIITLVLTFGNGLIILPILLVGGIQGLVGLVAGWKTIPYTIAITFGTLASLFLSAGR